MKCTGHPLELHQHMFHTDVTHKVMMGGREGLPAVRQTQ